MLASSGPSEAALDVTQLQGLLQGMLGESSASGAQAAELDQLRAVAQRLLSGGEIDPSALQLLQGSVQPESSSAPTTELRELQELLQPESNQRGLR